MKIIFFVILTVLVFGFSSSQLVFAENNIILEGSKSCHDLGFTWNSYGCFIENDVTYTIEPGTTFTIANATILAINYNGLLINNGTIVNTSGIHVFGTTFTNYGIIDNTSVIAVFKTDSPAKAGIVHNEGIINNLLNGTISNHSTLDNLSGGTINNHYGIIYNNGVTDSAVILNNFGTITNLRNGEIFNSSTLKNHGGGSIINGGDDPDNSSQGTIHNGGNIENGGTITNTAYVGVIKNYWTRDIGTITNESGGIINNYSPGNMLFGKSLGGIINNMDGTIHNSGIIDNEEGGILMNGDDNTSGTITNLKNGIINNTSLGIPPNNPGITNTGIISNQEQATINNCGSMLNTGDGKILNKATSAPTNPNVTCTANKYGGIYNSGTITNNQGTITNNPGIGINDPLPIINNTGIINNQKGGIIATNHPSTIDNTGTINNISNSGDPSRIWIDGGTIINANTINNASHDAEIKCTSGGKITKNIVLGKPPIGGCETNDDDTTLSTHQKWQNHKGDIVFIHHESVDKLKERGYITERISE